MTKGTTEPVGPVQIFREPEDQLSLKYDSPERILRRYGDFIHLLIRTEDEVAVAGTCHDDLDELKDAFEADRSPEPVSWDSYGFRSGPAGMTLVDEEMRRRIAARLEPESPLSAEKPGRKR